VRRGPHRREKWRKSDIPNFPRLIRARKPFRSRGFIYLVGAATAAAGGCFSLNRPGRDPARSVESVRRALGRIGGKIGRLDIDRRFFPYRVRYRQFVEKVLLLDFTFPQFFDSCSPSIRPVCECADVDLSARTLEQDHVSTSNAAMN
jgi:hypothetical protein